MLVGRLMNIESYLLQLFQKTHFKVHFDLSIKRRHSSDVYCANHSSFPYIVTEKLVIFSTGQEILISVTVNYNISFSIKHILFI